jgi:hypothetical protein
MQKIFISYPFESKDVAELLRDFLEHRGGIEAFWTDWEEITPGQQIVERVQEGVRESFCCVLLLNSYSVKSTWCMAEVGAFWGANKPIIVYPIQPRCDAPAFLQGLRRANSTDEVVRACKQIVLPAPPPPPPPFLDVFQNSGVANAFRIPVRDHEREARVYGLVREERQRPTKVKTFRLSASSGFNYLHSMGKVWRGGLGDAILKDGVEFSVVLESPFSPFAFTRALANERKWDHWKEKVYIEELTGLVKNHKVEVRVSEHPMNCSLFFTSSAVFYDPYLWGRPSPAGATENNFWVFEFRAVADPDYDCYGLLGRHFDFLWRNSESLEEFLVSSPTNFEDRRDDFHERLLKKQKSERR